MADGFLLSPEAMRQVERVVSERIREARFPRQTRNRWHKKGGGGGETDIIEGQVTDNDCPNGTLDITVKYTMNKNQCTKVIRVEDYFEIMDGHTAAQLTNAKALAGRVWDCSDEEWVWHLWLLAGLDECTGLP